MRSLVAESFPMFRCGERTVHPDGHVEIDGAYYPVPAPLLGEVRAQSDDHLVRVYHRGVLMIVHARVVAHAAMKYLVPVARANAADCLSLAEAITPHQLSTRQMSQSDHPATRAG